MRIWMMSLSLLVCFAFVIMDMKQIFDYKSLEGEVVALEKKQADLLSRHKQLLTSISVMSSFGRLESIAQERLKLEKVNPERVKKIILLPSSKGDT